MFELIICSFNKGMKTIHNIASNISDDGGLEANNDMSHARVFVVSEQNDFY